MRKNLMLLVNPAAGKGGYRQNLADVLETFCKSDYLPTVYMTAYPGHAIELIAESAYEHDLVVCMGGDGTLSETVSGLMRVPSPPPLGFIPLGTTNDVASTLSLPRDPLKAAERIIAGEPTPIDVGSFGNAEYFAYIAAFGAFTSVSYETPQDIKHTLGYLAYVLEGMRHLARAVNYRAVVEYDNGVIEDDFLFGAVANSTSIAGLLRFNENDVSLNDGLFEVILIKNPRGLADLNNIVSDIISKTYSSESVTVLHSREVRFIFEQPVAWTRDGDKGGRHREITLRNQHSAINILV